MAALAENYTQPEPFEVPEGGIATFLTATTGEWAEADKDDIPVTGIAGVKQVADKLAEYGRYEDEYMVHAAEGETVIPAQVLDLNPRLKAKLYREMREMGLEPERYIVGNELNSINPVTGQPEFFLKKLVKSIKKAVKSVVKVIKKVAPVVLPVVGAVFGGPLGAALASGAVTAAQGGNLKDVLKSAALAGVTTGVAQGVSAGVGAAQAGSATGLGNIGEFASGFGESVSSGLSGGYTQQFADMVSNIGSTASNVLQPEAQITSTTTTVPDATSGTVEGGFMSPQGGGGAFSQSANTGAAASTAQRTTDTITGGFVSPQGGGGAFSQAANAGAVSTSPAANLLQPEQMGTQMSDFAPPPPAPTTTQQALNMYDVADGTGFGGPTGGSIDTTGFFESMGRGFSELTQGNFNQFLNNMRQAFLPENFTADNLRAQFADRFGEEALRTSGIDFGKLANQLASESGPGFLRTYGPAALGAYGLLAATGGFDPEEVEAPQPFGGLTGSDYLSQTRPVFAPGVFRYAAGGGDIANFPRKNGAIYGPGTETSDDIPAMLSDGEFVMTARAVRGAGNGDRELGMKRMYDIMSRFEGDAIRGN